MEQRHKANSNSNHPKNGTSSSHTKAVMRLSELRHLPIVDLAIAKRVGTIEKIQIDTTSARIVALDVRLKDGSSSERIPTARARRIGHHALVIHGGSEYVPTPMDDDLWLESADLLGLEVMGNGGDRVGFLSDVYIDRNTLAVEAYELSPTFWERWGFQKPRIIMPDQIQASSRELMIIPSEQQAAAPAEVSWAATTLKISLGRRATADGAAEVEAKSA